MIRFRAGKGAAASPAQEAPAASAAPAGPSTYEWFEIPGKFRRPDIDEAEVDAINLGGGDKLWA